MNKALLVALAALIVAPLATSDAAHARPGWRRYRPGPVRYLPWYRPMWGPPVVVLTPPPPPVYYVEPPPPPERVVVVHDAPVQRYAPPPAPRAPVVVERPAPKREEPEARDFLGLGVHLSGATVSGEKVGISTAENPSMGGFGLHLRGRFSESFGLELSVDFLSGSSDDADLKQSTIPLMAGLTWHILPTSRLQPFLIAGVGVHFTRLEYFGGDYDIDVTELAGQLGGGIEFFITENLALTADLRFMPIFKNLDTKEKIATDCIHQVGSLSGFCDNIHFTDPNDKVDLGVQLSAGVSWYF